MSAPALSTTSTNASAQFAHLNYAALAQVATKRGTEKRWTAKKLSEEADRVPGNIAHVSNPLPPNWLKGSRASVEEREALWRSQAQQASGRAKLRATSPSLACAVVSWPRHLEKNWQAYRDSVLEFFEQQYGTGRIPGAVEHLDEANQHIHVYFVALDGEDFGQVHPGYAARCGARQAGKSSTRRPFIAAMKKWQDDLYAATGPAHGLQRVGPKRMRMDRGEYLSQKASEKLSADRASLAEEREAAQLKAKQDEALLKERRKKFEDDVQELMRAKVWLASQPAVGLKAELTKVTEEKAKLLLENALLLRQLEDFKAAERLRKSGLDTDAVRRRPGV